MGLYGYNYPWSGRLGRISKRCHFCGKSGDHFNISSHGDRCCDPACRQKRVAEIPEIAAETEAEYQRLARKWCAKRGIDFEATVANYEAHLGPPLQERDTPIPGAEKDYTVYFSRVDE